MKLSRKLIIGVILLGIAVLLGLSGLEERKWHQMKETIGLVETGMEPAQVHEILNKYFLTKQWVWSEMDCEEYRSVKEPTNGLWQGESSMMVCYRDGQVEMAGVSKE